jgi:hypothetical protein
MYKAEPNEVDGNRKTSNQSKKAQREAQAAVQGIKIHDEREIGQSDNYTGKKASLPGAAS